MLDHPSINIYFCIENDTRTNFTIPNGLPCITKKSYITNPAVGQFQIYNKCPSDFVDVTNYELIYDKMV